MGEQPVIEVVVTEDMREPREADSFRFRFEEEKIVFELGKTDNGSIVVISRIALSPELAEQFVLSFLKALYIYQEDTGFSFKVFGRKTKKRKSVKEKKTKMKGEGK